MEEENNEKEIVSEVIHWEEQSTLAKSRSQAYAFLSSIFRHLPDNDFVSNILELDIESWLASLGDENSLEVMKEGLILIQKFIKESVGNSLDDLQLEIARDRTKLLRGIMRGFGPVPPYEAFYIGGDAAPKANVHAEVRQAYADAGAGVMDEVKESPDYIGVELDFMRFLTQAEHQAWAADCPAKAFEMLSKQQAFLQDHVAIWIPIFCERMFEQANLDFYRGIAKLTKGFLLYESERIPEYLEQAVAIKADIEEGS